ncbi:DUF6526 family protein [Silvibacterium dinghuense]|uniref:Uncharacterized protein n=1 Tax=Silvibacterium dinghuense TaxID=1560006 RepID=A0A4Q1SGZ3_9BACT|nr:DUF6526 family protein [Silvibacterium dinghuense]RXS96625.1 hypothetical protein ESZ00_01355 [Silvibacterium dinghuense]GGG92333.1 hypothetical protein GCM10011586_03770 [Silvibacterium dinghuense]
MNSQPQGYANHAKFQPVIHFFLLPVLLANFILCVVWAVRHPGFQTVWMVVMAVALLVLMPLLRLNPLKVQDRVIRLEERVRLAALLPEPLKARIPELSVDQLIGLRFASDAELPALAARAMNEKLDRKQIKQAIQNWRPDDWRL